MRVKVSEALYNFLHARKTAANADLVDRWSIDYETQVNVMPANGEPVAGKRSTWSDGSLTWFNIRCPKNAATEPSFKDYKLSYPLDYYAEGIGMTGWRWTTRRSMWVAFDFDAMTDHAKGSGIPDEVLETVKDAACALPYVEVRRSTGGKGIHLYVYFDGEGIPTENHTVHAALARHVLKMMTTEVGFDFARAIDACGHVMWVWHRKMTAENHGLEIIKPAAKQLGVADLPANWRDHIEMVKGRRAKVRINDVAEDDLEPFEALTADRSTVPLDDSHKAQVEALMRSGFTTLWVADHHLLQTHTKALYDLFHGPEGKELALIGIFETISAGRDPGVPNCFLFPLPQGAWKAYRFTPGTKEADTWTQDGQSWTTCHFNRYPNLATACTLSGGVEREHGGYAFASPEDAIKAAKSLGHELKLDGVPEGRRVTLKARKDGRLVVKIKREQGDEPLEGWDNKNGKYVRIFKVKRGSVPLQIKLITCAELDGNRYELDYLIENTLVAKQPCIVAGPKKALKTTFLIDLGISLATGSHFLGQLLVKRPCGVIILSGESGLATLQETARRIGEAKGVSFSGIDNLHWSDFLPTLDDVGHLDALERVIQETGCEVLIVDPAYLCMPGTDAANLFFQGSLLRRVTDVCQRHNVGLVLAHHTRKKGKNRNASDYEPPELDDIAWAGFAEFARQWLLIGRREQYEPGTGEHKLWLNVGGSAGHSALWAVDVDEGVSGEPRYWRVMLSRPDEARAEKKTATIRKRVGSMRQAIVDALRKFPAGQTKTTIFETAGLKNSEAARNVLNALVDEKVLILLEVKKNGATYPGFRLSPETFKTHQAQA